MIIKNCEVFLPSRRFSRRDVQVLDGKVVRITDPENAPYAESEAVTDGAGKLLLPGLVDIHTHGAVGCDFSDGVASALSRIARYEASVGVTTFCPTSMSLPREELLQAFRAGREAAEASEQSPEAYRDAAHIAGFHMEGPFLSKKRAGAQKAEYLLPPDEALFDACQSAAGGRIRILTLAPECPGALSLIGRIGRDTVVSLGHTDADRETAARAFAAGARNVTHLWNGTPPFHHRRPGLIGAALEKADAVVELIADGIHVDDAVLCATFAMFPGRVALISDSMRAAGLSDGTYTLGGQEVRVSGRSGVLADGTIAGSVSNLFEMVAHAAEAGIAVEEAVAAATIIPAAAIGIDDRAGEIREGRSADLVMTDRSFASRRVMLNGQWL